MYRLREKVEMIMRENSKEPSTIQNILPNTYLVLLGNTTEITSPLLIIPFAKSRTL
jgi:hypothetical protein